MPQRNQAKIVSKEPDIKLAIQALEQDANLTVSLAAALYKVTESTLRRRHPGTLLQCE